MRGVPAIFYPPPSRRLGAASREAAPPTPRSWPAEGPSLHLSPSVAASSLVRTVPEAPRGWARGGVGVRIPAPPPSPGPTAHPSPGTWDPEFLSPPLRRLWREVSWKPGKTSGFWASPRLLDVQPTRLTPHQRRTGKETLGIPGPAVGPGNLVWRREGSLLGGGAPGGPGREGSCPLTPELFAPCSCPSPGHRAPRLVPCPHYFPVALGGPAC